MTKEELNKIALKAIATQIILTEQAVYKGENFVDGIDHHELSHHIKKETVIHEQLTELRRQELKEYREAYYLLNGELE